MAQQHTKSTAPKPSLFEIAKVLVRLGPKQINDEIALAAAQMKAKGIAAGIAAALMVVGLVFVTFLVVALIVAAIAGLHAAGLALWLAALIVAGAFLLIAAIFALIGVFKLKRTMPLKPEDAIRGFRLDLGVAREGTGFDPKTLDRQDEQKRRAKAEAKRKAAEQKKRDAKTPGAGKPQQPSYSELLRRTALRRDHIAGLQDQVRSRFPKKKPADDELASSPIAQAPPAAPAPEASGAKSEKSGAQQFLAQRWKPLAVAGGATAAAGAFLRELIKK
ncbi:phage holin family protein [Nesterenkonia ebinurensis]|uniref:phage holin family protein n=1 Tax=Nesterenkonia ebinurensis TaxID=2608252 RepID=UPI00168AF262|nr:phage holin family protein [Nesterenkonia ebinurensis]